MKYELENYEYGRHIEEDIYEGDDFAYHEDKYVCRCCGENTEDVRLNKFGVCKDCYESSMNYLVDSVKEALGDFFSDTEIDGGWYDDVVEELLCRL